MDYINRYPEILNSFYVLGTRTWPQGFLSINFSSVIANALLFLNLHTYERLFPYLLPGALGHVSFLRICQT